MITIYICEDHDLQRSALVDAINKYILINSVNAEIVVETNDPLFFKDQFEKRQDTFSIVFLDIEFDHYDFTGIDLAEQIRATSSDAKIIFISSHKELGLEILQKHIESYDFIVKNTPENIRKRVIDVLDNLLS